MEPDASRDPVPYDGRYDEAATAARMTTGAEGVILIVCGGSKGSGFSVQAPVPILMQVPRILRDVADHLEGRPPA